ncbi:hypothetical protein [Paenibacillus sp. UNC496MF]|uniref:hypothetical protein n=1 Tax=Paenibacillus sp. UNC496MF TaxID=1502753 RepID=UPI0011606319|nr:hypothetical protein [Paenibacillus sp. UNC496MF]
MKPNQPDALALFSSIVRLMQMSETNEVPIATCHAMHLEFTNDRMCYDEAVALMDMLVARNYLSVRVGQWGVKMLSPTSYGHERLALYSSPASPPPLRS